MASTRSAKKIVETPKVSKPAQQSKAPAATKASKRTKAPVIDEPDNLAGEPTETSIAPASVTQLEAFRMVHNSKVGHMGARVTWSRLNNQFPGHSLSMNQIADLISTCHTCLKTRSTLMHSIKPIIRSLKPPHQRSTIGIDALEITPHGPEGHTHLLVIVNLFTKHTFLYRAKGCTAANLATAIWTYWANFGHTDSIISDQGPDLTSNLMRILTEWMQTRHQFSITDMHTNGVERILKEVQRHLRAIVYDERIKDIFADKTMIPAIQFLLNDEVSSETGYRPFELTFGSTDSNYTKIPTGELKDRSSEYLNQLNYNLQLLREISTDYQQGITKSRVEVTPLDKQNKYMKGDFVLLDKGPKPHPKMGTRYKGPYEVIQQIKNDVEARHVIMGNIERFDVERLIVFPGDKAAAREAAKRDHDQYDVVAIHRHTGDPEFRNSMKYLIEYADGDSKWMWFSKDIFLTVQYADYVKRFRYLEHLALSLDEAKRFKADFKNQAITSVKPGDVVYVDVAWYGNGWMENIPIPDIHPRVYVFEFQYTHWYHDLTLGKNPSPTVSKVKISAYCKVIDKSFALTAYLVYAYGSNKVLDTSKMVLLTEKHIQLYPQICA